MGLVFPTRNSNLLLPLIATDPAIVSVFSLSFNAGDISIKRDSKRPVNEVNRNVRLLRRFLEGVLRGRRVCCFIVLRIAVLVVPVVIFASFRDVKNG